MFNEAIRTLAASAVAAGMLLTSCSGDREAAESLREQAMAAIEGNDPAGALLLLDSIDRKYPGEIETRRAALSLRPKAIELQTIVELEETDSLLAQAQVTLEKMKDIVTLKNGPEGIDGYYVASSAPDKVPSEAEGLYARMSPEGMFYLISSSRKGTLTTAVRLSTSDGREARTPVVPHDGERNDRSLDAEIVTFFPAESDTIGNFVLLNPDQEFSLTFIGESVHRSTKLKPDQARAIAEVYAASRVFNRARLLALRKSKLEQQLMLARSQEARTTPDHR